MKKIALSVAALALTAGSALAADLPSRKGPPMLPPPPPPPLWTGFYVGLNAGYGWSGSNTITNAVTPFALGTGAGAFPASVAAAAASSSTFSTNNSGFVGGGQIGYNYQFYNNFLVGLEADIQGIAGSSGARSSIGLVPVVGFPANPAISINSASSSLDYIGTVRGRLGWLFTPTLLVYGTGGLAYGGVTLNSAFAAAFANTAIGFTGGSVFADTRTGWTAGGGLEWMFWPNWSAKVEYLYYDLGTVSQTYVAAAPNAAGGLFFANAGQTTARFNGNLVRAGLNYHFNWGAPAPVVAKY